MFRIGSLELTQRLLLAPLSGISDLPFRLINRAHGCELAFTEMISARSLLHQSTTSSGMLRTIPEDRPLGLQLLGNDPEVVVRAMGLVEHTDFDVIDLNAACPVPKVTRKGEGSALMGDPVLLRSILGEMVRHAGVPVTVKIRSGWDETAVNAVEVAKMAQDSGVAALTIHGRTRKQGYSGSVDYDIIRKVKEALSIPIIASGDVLSPVLIRKMFDETGCDAVVIARGALGNPWIFSQGAAFLESGATLEPTGIGERTAVMKCHLRLCCSFHGDRAGTILFRKFFVWYCRGIPHGRHLKDLAFTAQSCEKMEGLIDELQSLQEVSL